MAEQTHVTKENLTQFQRWLLGVTKDNASIEFVNSLHFDLPLSVILEGAPTLPDLAQEIIGRVLADNRGYQDQNADAETLLKLAKTQPIALGVAYRRSGNSRGGQMYSKILGALRRRKFEDNIPVIDVLMRFLPVPADMVGTGDIAKTSAENTKILNHIFEQSVAGSSNKQFDASASDLINYLDMSKLLNFEGASPSFRERINAANFNGWRINKTEQIEKINPELIDEQILRDFINAGTPRQKDISGAKTQKEKNANILPISYTKPRDALLRLVEKEEIHDRNNYGRLKTLTQRFKDLKDRMKKKRVWPEYNQYADNLMRDVYLKVIQRDIMNGRAADLTQEELQMALSADKNAFYIRHIPTDLLKNLTLNKKQLDLIAAGNPDNVEHMVGSTLLSAHDKRAALENVSRTLDNEAPVREQLAAELAQHDKDYEGVQSSGAAYQNAFAVYTSMQQIQAAAKHIRDNLKNGKPNAQEAHLAEDALETAIYNYITGASDKDIAIPQQSGLPLFGRGAERDRREHLERAIHDFDKLLAEVRKKANEGITAMWAEYRGAILNPDSLRMAGSKMNGAENAANAKHSEFIRTHRNRRDIESDNARYAGRLDSLGRATVQFEQQQAKMRQMSAEHLGRNQTGELTPVTDDMSPEEKRSVRQKNKTMLQDKLALRRNRPARNIAEMLERNTREM